jgi:hypothetical protein
MLWPGSRLLQDLVVTPVKWRPPTALMTTRAKALTSATPGDYVPGSAHVKVFLITMRGHFTARGATGRPGAKAPAGRYLSLVIDAKTFQGLDFGIGPNPPPVPPARGNDRSPSDHNAPVPPADVAGSGSS